MIAFDVTHANHSRRTGIGRVVEEHIRSLVWLHENNDFPLGSVTLVSAQPFRLPGDLLAQVHACGMRTAVLACPSMYVYRATRLPLWTIRARPDLVFIPEPIVPAPLRARRLAVMHYDLITRQSPAAMARHIRLLYRMFLLPTLRRATRVGIDSEFVRRQTAELVPGLLDKSEVLPIYLHDPDRIAPAPPPSIETGQPFALFIGNLLPHKNVRRLLDAFERWHADAPDTFIPLVVVGRPRPEVDDLAPRLAELESRAIVRHIGYAADEHLAWLYRHARCLAFPSLIEGYGLPILEAMSHDLPVLTSRGVATEEAAAGAALLVDPRDDAELRDALRRIVTDDALRADLVARGRAHAQTFTRQRHAHALRDFLARALA